MNLRARPHTVRLPDWIYLLLLACTLPLIVPVALVVDAVRRRRHRDLTPLQRILSESSRDAGGPTGSYTGGFGQGWRS